jgi:hypothetical protein
VFPFAQPDSSLYSQREKMKIVGPDEGMKSVEINGTIIDQHKDGTFHTDQYTAKKLVSSGDFAVTGITFRGIKGNICDQCGFNSLYRDKCGRCGCTQLTPEE